MDRVKAVQRGSLARVDGRVSVTSRSTTPGPLPAASSLPVAGRLGDPVPGSAAGQWAQWSALELDLHDVSKRDRVAVWRELRRIRALNLRPGLWAVGHGPDGGLLLDRVRQILGQSNAALTLIDPPADRMVGEELDRALGNACRHLWDPFFNDLDRLLYDISTAPRPDQDHYETYERLRSMAAEARGRDLLGREAQRALRRLAECDQMLAGGDEGQTEVTGPQFEARARRIGGSHGVALRDGTVRYHFAVEPPPPAAWERSFRVFERRSYLAADDRAPLECQSFVAIAPARQLAELQAALDRRLDLYARSCATVRPTRSRSRS